MNPKQKVNILFVLGFVLLSNVACKTISLNNKTNSFDLVFPNHAEDHTSLFLLGYDLDTSVNVDWVFDLNAAMSNVTPYFSSDYMLVPTKYGKLYAVDRKTAKQWGVRNLSGAVVRAFHVENETVYVGTSDKNDGTLYSYDVKNRRNNWNTDTGSIESELLAFDEWLVAGTYNGKIICVNKQTGRINWTYILPRTHRILSNFILFEKNILTMDDKGVLLLLDSQTGQVLKQKKITENYDGKLYEKNGNLFFADRKGNLFCVQLSDFSLVWEKENQFGKITDGFTFEDSLFYATTIKGSLISVRLSDGQTTLLKQLDEGTTTVPVVTPNQIIVSQNNAKMIVLDKHDFHEIKSYHFDGRVKSPLFLLSPTEGYLYVEDKLWVRLLKNGETP